MRRLAVIPILILGCGAAVLGGHEILGPAAVNQILKSLQQSQVTLKGDAPASKKEDALFNLGVDGYALMKLINSDIQEHGAESDRGLIALAISRAKGMGVSIQPAAGEDYYLYDFEAFTSYLKLAPRGAHAAEARFALIEKSFYDQRRGQRSVPVVLKQVQEKKQLLQEFPKFSRRADLEAFLILDYVELHTVYEARNDAAKSAQYRTLAMDLCQQVLKDHPDTGASSLARDLLLKFGL